MYRILIGLMAMFVGTPILAITNPTTFSWTAPTENTDGSALTDLAGFKLHCGLSSGNYATPPLDIPIPTATTAKVSDVVSSDATHFCAITAYDTAGGESSFSNEVSFEINKIGPKAPTEFKVTMTFNPDTRILTITIEGNAKVVEENQAAMVVM